MMPLFSFWILALLSAEPAAYSQWRQKLAGVKSFEVRFTQQVVQDLFAEPAELAEGTLQFAKPHRMAWTYIKPRPREILFDGQKLVIKDGQERHEVKDIGRVTLEKSFAFLWGQLDPAYFAVEERSSTSFRILPRKRADVNFEFMEVHLVSGLISSLLVKDKLGGESRLQFADWKLKR